MADELTDQASEPIDTFNKFMVSFANQQIVILRPPTRRISYQDALLLAAYLVTMVGDDERWQRTLKAVENT